MATTVKKNWLTLTLNQNRYKFSLNRNGISLNFQTSAVKLLVRDVRPSANSLPYGTYITTLHIQNIPNTLRLLFCYTVTIFYVWEQN